MQHQFPRHSEAIRVGTADMEALTTALLAKRSEYRRLACEIADLESELKTKIGLFKGLRVKSGTWFWSKVQGKRRIDWHSLAESLKISASMIEKFTKSNDGPRFLKFVRSKEPIWSRNTPQNSSNASESQPTGPTSANDSPGT